ncbi:MAG: AraC family transcriptional regulator [Xanthomonadales bacterium]|nr:AraC family transcriptional regulator [Xanthomonadales bacterium]
MSTIYSERLFARHQAVFKPHLASVGLPETIFRRPDIEVPIEKYLELLDLVARHSNPSIGLTMGESVEAADLGVYGHAMAATANVAELLRVMARYIYVFAQLNTIRVNTAQNSTVISYSHNGPQKHLAIHDVEFAMAAVLTVIRRLTGREVTPQSVDFDHDKPEYAREYARIFGCEVHFGRRGNRIHIDNRVLDWPVLTHDPGLLGALEFSLADRLKIRSDEEDIVTRVKHLVSANLSEGPVDIDSVASALGLSRRTLQRRLADAGDVFNDLVESVRIAFAKEYIQHSDYSLTDIALMLGYGELSSFSRAFKRWTGKSPQQFRA